MGHMDFTYGFPNATRVSLFLWFQHARRILEFLYTDAVTDIDHDVAVPLLIAAERFLLDRLKGICEPVLCVAFRTLTLITSWQRRNC